MSKASHTILAGSERAVMPGARVVCQADAHEWVEVNLKLRRKAPLPEIKGRPKKFMSYTELVAKHGASADDIEKVRKAVERHGLNFVEANPATRSVRFGGLASAAEEAFRVKLFHYTHEQGAYRGRVGAVCVPAELDGIVEAVFGLDERRVIKRRGGLRQSAVPLSAAKAAHRPWFFPAELAAIYDFPPGDGQGQCVGLIEFGGGYFEDDLRTFCQTANVSVPNVKTISVDHTPTDARDGAEGEVMLDVEVVAGVCPQANIVLYFGKFTEGGWVNVLDSAVHDQESNPGVISISWGYAEDYPGAWTPAAIQAVNQALQEAALLGKTICVASGDDGSGDAVNDGHAHVDFPSSSAFVLAVGGTILRLLNGKPLETAWKDGTGIRPNGGSTGGGVSDRIQRPGWQNSPIASVNHGSILGRIVPDVAANASANTGYWTVVDGQGAPSGGTSAAAPLWAALIARINAKLPPGKRVGYLTPVLYQSASGGTIGSTSCKDITSGNNITAAAGGYQALPGFDAVSGWGSPLGARLLAALQQVI